MEIDIKHIGAYGNKAASILEITIKSRGGSSFTEDILDFKTNLVDIELIEQLEYVVNEMKEHNEIVKRCVKN